jgi:uncharacterized protein HemY
MDKEDEKLRNKFLQLELERHMNRNENKDVHELFAKTPQELMNEPDLAIQVIAYIQKLKKESK